MPDSWKRSYQESALPIEIVGDLSTNTVEVDNQFLARSNGRISVIGTGNFIKISTDRPADHIWIDADGDCSLIIGRNSYFGDLHCHLREKSIISIGANTYAISKINLFSHEHARIIIGENCLIGDLFECLASDMHSILDVDSNLRINPPGDIVIGDRVWCGARVTIMKNTVLGSGSIVGVGSYVSGEFPENCLILGYPARLAKRNVTWDVNLLPLST